MVRILLGLLITATLGRYLDADEFGFYALVSSLLLLSAVVMDMGTGSVAIREIGRAPADERQILGALLTWRRTISWAAAAAFLLGALLVAPGPRRWVLLCCCVAALLSPAAGLSVVSQVRQAQGALQLMGLAAQGAVLTGCFLLHAVGVPGLYFACLPSIRELLNVAGTTLLARRRLGYVPRSRSRPPTGEQVLRGAKLQGAAVLVQAAYFHVDVILVRALRGEAELGAYAAAFRGINPLFLLPGVLTAPLLPLFAAGLRNGDGRFHLQVTRAFTVMVGLGAVVATTGAMASEELLGLLYGDRFTQGPASSVSSLRWLSIALGCVFSTAVVGAATVASREDRAALRVAVTGLLLNTLGNLVLLPILGFEAAAMTTAATEAWVLFATLRVFSRRHGHPFVARDLARTLIPTAILSVTLAVVARSGGPLLLTAIAGAVVSGSVVLWGPAGRGLRRALRDV